MLETIQHADMHVDTCNYTSFKYTFISSDSHAKAADNMNAGDVQLGSASVSASAVHEPSTEPIIFRNQTNIAAFGRDEDLERLPYVLEEQTVRCSVLDRLTR